MASVCVIGAGYVGLTTSCCLAQLGHKVLCIDTDFEKIRSIKNGVFPIVEAGLDKLSLEMTSIGKLEYESEYSKKILDYQFIFLCVPTPQDEDGSADLSYLRRAVTTLLPLLRPNAIIVNKSTVPVGSTLVVEELVGRSDVYVTSNPEFLREGSALFDFLNPDRIIVGSSSVAVAKKVINLYSKISAPKIICDPSSAETIKYASNAFLATKLSFANAIAALCEHVGADIHQVINGMGLDKRIGKLFLNPGPGWGGSCFPKDTKALVKIADDAGYDFALLRGVIEFNEIQLDRIVKKISDLTKSELAGKSIAVLGLTFKAHTDDLRESPSLRIIEKLLSHGCQVNAYDPTVKDQIKGVVIHQSSEAACRSAHVILIATEWPEFSEIDPQAIAAIVNTKNIVDARNVLDRRNWEAAGFNYKGVGK